MAVTRSSGAGAGLRGGGIAAIVFAVLFVVGFLMIANTPEGDETNREWIRHFADEDNRRMIVIGIFVLALAALAFLIFLGALRERLRAVAGVEWLASVAFASGIVFVAMVGVFALGVGSVSAGIEIADNPVPRDADVLRGLDSLGFGAMLVFGSASAGLLILATSIVSGRAALLPRWLVVAGYVVGVLVIIGGVIFIPLALFVLWMLAVGILMISRSRAAV